ncbi:Rad10 and/or HHH 5 domain containing protein [Asbolus verrucosus]|uniref:Rad10 and/or HHH 5 domain containing protein n=1 Tax=Asbolus verrucosus TaxID=1661398 RepID=A0A482W0M7_ASBVE|nr:Rad10 and/or HHH 5 domain containing protein [Asbolus verrucosus]
MLNESLESVAAEFEAEFTAEDSQTSTNSASTSESKEETNAPTSSKSSSKTHCLLVSPKQRGNPLLKSVCNVPWEYDDIVPDYQMADLTLILAWSAEEAGKIIETYKIYENKPADDIMERSESSPYLKLIQALTTIKPINKSDAMTLIARFKTLEGIIQASEYQLAECPGLGPRKAKKLYTTLHEKFCRN